VERQVSHFAEESFLATESTKMTLADVVRVKRMADDINFMRLFYLKNPAEHIERRSLEQSNSDSSLELIDCVMAIYLFEISRAVRTGKHLYRKDQFQYQVLHFLTNLKSCKVDQDVS
jgi:CO dehydrogenase nickel-insertion accessory protein CooC1